MKSNKLNKILYLWIFLIVCIGFCMLSLTQSNIAYAASENVQIIESKYYKNYESIDSTNFYRDTTIQNAGREYPVTGENFAFELGAGVLKDDLNSLVFRLNLTNPEFEKDKATWFTQSFVLYECSADGKTFNPIMDAVILHISVDGAQSEIIMLKRFEYSDTQIGIVNYLQGFTSKNGNPFWAFYFMDGYESLGAYVFQGSNLLIKGGHSLDVVVKPSSPYIRYFLRSTSTLMMSGKNNVKSDVIDSSKVSVYDVLKKMYGMESLDALNDRKAEAESIINNYAMQRVQIQYLKQIGTTPFASAVTEYINVPVVDGVIKVADARAALGIQTMAVMQSACDHFVYDANDDIYKAYYYKSVWLSAKTAEGQTQDIYLDCNLSFRDFYYPYVRDGILPSGNDGYEYFFNRIKQKCPEVIDYQDYELYGYFGYVMMPLTYSFSQFMFEICDSEQANYKGTVDSIRNTGVLSKSSYNKLLNDYNYGWLQRIWNNVIGALDEYQAYHYSFYVDSGVIEAFIAHNGAKDMYDNASRVGVGVRDTASKISNFVSEALNALRKWFDDNSKLFAIIAGVIVGVTALLIVLLIVSKISGKKVVVKKSKDTKSQKKSKSRSKRKR